MNDEPNPKLHPVDAAIVTDWLMPDDDEDMTWDNADGRYPVDADTVPLHCPYCGGFMAYQGIDDGCGDYGDAIADIFACVDCGHTEEHNAVTILDNNTDGDGDGT